MEKQIAVELPRSYAEALARGWAMIHEKTPLVSGEGKLLMRRDGVSQLITVRYESTSTGYSYAAPQLATADALAEADDSWGAHYRAYGCMSCSTTEKPHAGFGLCETCIERVRGRLQEAIRAAA